MASHQGSVPEGADLRTLYSSPPAMQHPVMYSSLSPDHKPVHICKALITLPFTNTKHITCKI